MTTTPDTPDIGEDIDSIMSGVKERVKQAAANYAAVLATEIPRESEEDFRRHKEPWRTGHVADEIEVEIASEGRWHIKANIVIGYPWVHVEDGTRYIKKRDTATKLFEVMREGIEQFISGGM